MIYEQRYIPLIQKPYCCAIACLCMILFRRTGKLYDQEELARYFWVKVSQDVQSAFSQPMKLLTAHNLDEGISTLTTIPLVREVFRSIGIEANICEHQFESKNTLEQQILTTLAQDGDVWCEFVDGPLDIYQELSLHDNLIETYDQSTKILTMIDPAWYKRNRYSMHFDDLISRVSGKYGRKTGLVTVL